MGCTSVYLQFSEISLEESKPFLDCTPLYVILRRFTGAIGEATHRGSPAFREEGLHAQLEFGFFLQVESIDLVCMRRVKKDLDYVSHLFKFTFKLEKKRCLVRTEIRASIIILTRGREDGWTAGAII